MAFLDSSCYIPTSVEAGRVRSLGHGVKYRIIMTKECRSIAKGILNVYLESPPSTSDVNWTLYYFSNVIAKVSVDAVNRMILQ